MSSSFWLLAVSRTSGSNSKSQKKGARAFLSDDINSHTFEPNALVGGTRETAYVSKTCDLQSAGAGSGAGVRGPGPAAAAIFRRHGRHGREKYRVSTAHSTRRIPAASRGTSPVRRRARRA